MAQTRVLPRINTQRQHLLGKYSCDTIQKCELHFAVLGYFQIFNRSKHRDLLAVAPTTPDKDIKCSAKADVSPPLCCARCMSRLSAPWITEEVKTAKRNLRWAKRRGSNGPTVHKLSLSKETREKKTTDSLS